MKTLLQSFLVILALAITIGAALLHGQKSNRWGTNQEIESLAAAVREFPAEVGNWTQTNERELGDNAQQILGCWASFTREYQHNQTGETVQIAILLGPTGPISVHTPDVCFNSVNYKIHKPRTRIEVGPSGFGNSFWSIYFQSRDVDGGFLRSVYGWSDDGDWKSPDSARIVFAGKPYLFKLQTIATNQLQTAIETGDSIERFLDEFIPMFRKQIRKSGD